MQEEADMLVDVADLVEEYCEEVTLADEVEEIEEWVFDVGGEVGQKGWRELDRVGEKRNVEEAGHPRRRTWREREDPGLD